jgi:hypothetical protein
MQHQRLPVLKAAAPVDLRAQLAFVGLQRGRHRVERLAQLPELARTGQAAARVERTGPP